MLKLGVFSMAAFFTFSLQAQTYPVHDDIDSLLKQAADLKEFVAFLETNQCTVTFSKTTLVLTPTILRTPGIRAAIGDNFPGNYLAFHNTLQPAALILTVADVFQDNKKAEDVFFFEATKFESDLDGKKKIRFEIAEPFLTTEPEDDFDPSAGAVSELIYKRLSLFMDLPINPEGSTVEATMKNGKVFNVTCRPK